MSRSFKLLQILIAFHLYGCAQAYEMAEFYRATKIADISRPRGLFLDSSGDILVASISSGGRIRALRETADGVYTSTQIVNAADSDLSHSVIHHEGYIYASSESAVYRWPYEAGSQEVVTTAPEVVIDGMSPGGHYTRTLIFDSNGVLYVTIGSDANVDDDSSRARVRRFRQLDPATFPIDFNTGEVLADGTRNTVGIAFDAQGDLWGVDNGADYVNRPDLNVTYNGNPADELNRFLASNLGGYHGYPFCFSIDEHAVYPRGTQFAWPTTMNDGTHDDAWCQNLENNIPPALALPNHQAPLGIEFYAGQGCGEVEGAFPCDVIGDAFVSFHGSWNSDIPVGYRVGRLPFTKSGDHLPTGEIINVIYEPDTVACGGNCFRPVNAIFNSKGHLIISDDSAGEIIRITYEPNLVA